MAEAIRNLNPHKNDGYIGLSTDHFLHASNNLSVYNAFLFTCIITHGHAPKEFRVSTIIPIPKNGILTGQKVITFLALHSVLSFVKFWIIWC